MTTSTTERPTGAQAGPETGGVWPIRILIVDDHQMFAECITAILGRDPSIEVVGVTGTAAEGVALAGQERPDVAIVDYRLPDRDGFRTSVMIRAVSPGTRVLSLTGSDDPDLALEAFEAGCSGFLTKDKAVKELVAAVHRAHVDGAYMPPAVLTNVLSKMSPSPGPAGTDLTRREHEILVLLAKGLRNKAIADQLVLSVHTVRNHVQNILTKLQAHSKLEAVSIALRHGVLDVTR